MRYIEMVEAMDANVLKLRTDASARQAVLDDFRNLHTIKSIARKFNVSAPFINKILRTMLSHKEFTEIVIRARERYNPAWNPSDPDAVLTMIRAKGMSYTARHFGVSFDAIRGWLTRYDPTWPKHRHPPMTWR